MTSLTHLLRVLALSKLDLVCARSYQWHPLHRSPSLALVAIANAVMLVHLTTTVGSDTTSWTNSGAWRCDTISFPCCCRVHADSHWCGRGYYRWIMLADWRKQSGLGRSGTKRIWSYVSLTVRKSVCLQAKDLCRKPKNWAPLIAGLAISAQNLKDP